MQFNGKMDSRTFFYWSVEHINVHSNMDKQDPHHRQTGLKQTRRQRVVLSALDRCGAMMFENKRVPDETHRNKRKKVFDEH